MSDRGHATSTTFPQRCSGTWPPPVGHLHVCARIASHRGRCQCMCGAMAALERVEPTEEETNA